MRWGWRSQEVLLPMTMSDVNNNSYNTQGADVQQNGNHQSTTKDNSNAVASTIDTPVINNQKRGALSRHQSSGQASSFNGGTNGSHKRSLSRANTGDSAPSSFSQTSSSKAISSAADHNVEMDESLRSKATAATANVTATTAATTSAKEQKSVRKSAVKKVLTTASVPFRKVKRRFSTHSDKTKEDEYRSTARSLEQAKNELADNSSNHSSASAAKDRVAKFVSRNMSPVASILTGRSSLNDIAGGVGSGAHEAATSTLMGQSTISGGTDPTHLSHRSHATASTMDSNGATDTVVKQAETLLRVLCIVIFAYSLGTRYPSYANIATKLGEYAAVAWTTCVVIRVAAIFQQQKERRLHQQGQPPLVTPMPTTYYDEEEGGDEVADSPPTEETPLLASNADRVVERQNYATTPISKARLVRETSTADQKLERPVTPMSARSKSSANSPRTPASVKSKTSRDSRQSQDEDVMNNSDSLNVPDLKREQTSGEFTTKSKNQEQKQTQTQTVVHPSLQPFFVVDTATNGRIYANTSAAYLLDNDYFKGELRVLIRTPDVDDYDAENPRWRSTNPKNENDAAVKYFSDKQRRFEFQFQLKLKRVPKGRVYFACELKDAVKMGMIQRAFVGAAMAFIKSTNKSFHYSLSGTPETPDGRFESPHMAFPVEEGMNRVVATPPGQKPPTLGGEIYEEPESIKQRKKGMRIEFNTTDTYTFSLWSAYVDFLEWRCLNLPGIRPFGITSVIANQPILLTLYEIPETDGTTGKPLDKHYKSEMVSIVTLEMCNSAKSDLGPATKLWKAQHQKDKKHEQKKQVTNSNTASPTGQSAETSISEEEQKLRPSDDLEEEADLLADENEALGEDADVNNNILPNFEEIEDDETEAAAEELGEGIYLRSGDTIALKELTSLVATGADNPTETSLLLEDNRKDGLQRLESGSSGHNQDRGSKTSSSGSSCFLTQAGGFAVLHENSPQAIIIEKAGKRSARRTKTKGALIKDGDTVVFKVIVRGNKSDEAETTKYLSLHRGWWLKWVSAAPTKNGYFTIHNDDRVEGTFSSSKTQSSYINLGTSIWLKHKRWSKYRVGISAEGSTAYGGRMLGLHILPKNGSGSNLGEFPQKSDEEDIDVDATSDVEEKQGDSKQHWMRPLYFQPCEYSSLSPTSVTGMPAMEKKESKNESLENEDFEADGCNAPKFIFAQDHYQMDVPAWVEIINRTERIRQHAYAVRVQPPGPFLLGDTTGSETDGTDEDRQEKNEVRSFVRLRTGRDLAPVMRTGLKWRNRIASPRKAKPTPISESARTQSLNDTVSPSQNVRADVSDAPTSPASRSRSFSTSALLESHELMTVHSLDGTESFTKDDEDVADLGENARKDGDISDEEWEGESTDGSEQAFVVETGGEGESVVRKQGKGRKLIGKVAKAVKTKTASTGRTIVIKTASTGKNVVRKTTSTGKNVVLGSLNAGKAILPIRSQNPSIKEPKSATKRQARKQRDRDLDLDVRSSSVRRIELLEAKSSKIERPLAMAGELSAPEQSCRTVSNMVSKMSAEPESSSVELGFSSLLSSLVDTTSEQDNNFLRGGALQLGVAPSKKHVKDDGPLLFDCVVARCLWESHWREEWCGLYKKELALYSPLTTSPCLELALEDIKCIRLLDQGENPLPGYPLLVIETAWLCHCCAFADEDVRQAFYLAIEQARKDLTGLTDPVDTALDNELSEARFWQGFQNSLDFSLALGRGKWDNIQSGSKTKSRIVLNNRRMAFDLDHDIGEPTKFVEKLLTTALSFSLASLKQHPEELVRFLDSASHLRKLPLDGIDRSSKNSLCLFVNLYHCLLQHALLFSVNGTLQKRSCLHFMRTSCYEVGGEVFSLAELHSCVIRGKMSRAIAPKPPYVDVPKKSNTYRLYALDIIDPRINFVLNTADVACPRPIPVLNIERMEDQIKSQVAAFLRTGVVVDSSKKQVVLPKVFEIYKNDFSQEEKGSTKALLLFCIPYLDSERAHLIHSLLQNDVSIKFHPSAEQFHSSLYNAG